jgi:lipopolysaccharide/colanic/teichoic acid biosynthesis glycosyltransferase
LDVPNNPSSIIFACRKIAEPVGTSSSPTTSKIVGKKMMLRTFLIFILSATVIGLVVTAKTLLTPTAYYPYMTINGPKTLRIHILQRGQYQESHCAQLLESQANVVKSGCANCSIETSACLTNLGNAERQWLDDKPITMHSVRMVFGVTIFEAQQEQLALAACQESEKQSLKFLPLADTRGPSIKCFPAGTERPLLMTEKNILEQEYAKRQKSIVVGVASIFGLLTLVAILLGSLNRIAVKDPTEFVSTEGDGVQPAVWKLSNILKRVFDILVSVGLLIALLPILFVVAILVRMLEGAPIFYMSRRFISAEKSVTILKFRTMVKDAISPKYQLKERFMRDGYLDIPLDCEVYTPIGRFLERSQLVETLQLLNILLDGMSFVGNRPLPKDNIELLKKFGGWQERFDSPAGITGISQIVGKYGLLPQQRLYLERMYASIYRNPDGNVFLCDLCIIGYTAYLLLTGRYLDYRRAVAFLLRCGADKHLLIT